MNSNDPNVLLYSRGATTSLPNQFGGNHTTGWTYKLSSSYEFPLQIFLHGTLIWFGDILTLYGIAGFCILSLAGARLKNVRRIFWCWFAVWVSLRQSF